MLLLKDNLCKLAHWTINSATISPSFYGTCILSPPYPPECLPPAMGS